MDAKIKTILAAVCPRVFPDVAAFNTTRPYVTYQRIGGEVINPMGKEIPAKENAFVQVNVWADTRLQASSVMQQIEDAFRMASTVQAYPQSAMVATHEEDLNLYGARQDFNVWADR